MNLAKSKQECLLDHMRGYGSREIEVAELQHYAAWKQLSRGHLKKMLCVLEKADQLVRLSRGVYITMDEYTRRTTEGTP